MRKIYLAMLITIVAFVFTVSAAYALPNNQGIEKAKVKSPAINEDGQVVAPPEFVQNLPESQLNSVVFIRYADESARNKPCNNDNICDVDEGGWCGDCKNKDAGTEDPVSTCYGFLSGPKPHWN